MKPRLESLHVEDIEALGNRRQIDQPSVERLAESMRTIGLMTPITVRIVEEYVDPISGEIIAGQPILVAGAHRLAAAKLLGWDAIDCYVQDDDEISARLWEIAENLHRADLTVLQRSEQIAEWVRLVDERSQSTQVVLIEASSKREDGKGHRPEGGLRAAARELGIDREKVRRAVKIAAIETEARDAAREAGIDDNQSALERVARSTDQVAEVRRIASERAAVVPGPRPPVREGQAKDWRSGYEQLMRCWERAGQESRTRFLEDIEQDEPMKSFVARLA